MNTQIIYDALTGEVSTAAVLDEYVIPPEPAPQLPPSDSEKIALLEIQIKNLLGG